MVQNPFVAKIAPFLIKCLNKISIFPVDWLLNKSAQEENRSIIANSNPTLEQKAESDKYSQTQPPAPSNHPFSNAERQLGAMLLHSFNLESNKGFRGSENISQTAEVRSPRVTPLWAGTAVNGNPRPRYQPAQEETQQRSASPSARF